MARQAPDVVSGSYYIEPIGCSRCKGDGSDRRQPG